MNENREGLHVEKSSENREGLHVEKSSQISKIKREKTIWYQPFFIIKTISLP